MCKKEGEKIDNFFWYHLFFNFSLRTGTNYWRHSFKAIGPGSNGPISTPVTYSQDLTEGLFSKYTTQPGEPLPEKEAAEGFTEEKELAKALALLALPNR